MFIEVQEGLHSPVDNTLKNINLIITRSGNYSVTINLTEDEAKDLINEVQTAGLKKFNWFRKEAVAKGFVLSPND